MSNNGFCGLLVKGREATVPLKTVSYDVVIRSFASRIKIDQTYVNNEQTELECVYKFPIHDKASVIGFQVTIDGRILTSQFKKKDEAFQDYNDALARGHGAYLLDQSDDRDDTFVMSVGRLPPGKECIVTINYVSTLEPVDQTNLRLTIPLAIIPRCIEIHSSQQMPLRQNPSLPSAITCQLNARIETHEDIKSVTSPTHRIDVNIQEAKQAEVTFRRRQQLDRDFILNIELKNDPEHHVEVEEYAPNKFAAMYSFLPNISQFDKDVVYDLVFLVDCSGSMAGNNIEHARTAMQLFLRSLPKNCLFNFYKFGSVFTSLFPESVPYDESSFKMAKKYASVIQANMGGTGLYVPLRTILWKPVKASQRIVFVLTDGGVTDPAGVVELVRQNAKHNRVFSFGIGSSVSSNLVNGLAKAGNGKAEFINEGSDLSAQVCRHLRGALQPSIFGAVVSLEGRIRKLQLLPEELPVLFAGEHAMVFAVFEVDPYTATSEVAFVLRTKSSTIRTVVSLKDTQKGAHSFLSELAARAIIKELESRTIPDSDRITKLSLEFGLVSKYVSLIAIETRENAQPGHMELREIAVDQASAVSFSRRSSYEADGFDGYSATEGCSPIRNLRDVSPTAGVYADYVAASYKRAHFFRKVEPSEGLPDYDSSIMLSNLRRMSLDMSSNLDRISDCNTGTRTSNMVETNQGAVLTKDVCSPERRKNSAGEKMMGVLGRIRSTADKLLMFTKSEEEKAQMMRTREIEKMCPGPSPNSHANESDGLTCNELRNQDLSKGFSTNGSSRAEGVSENFRIGSLKNILLLQNWDGSWNLDYNLVNEMPDVTKMLKNLASILSSFNLVESVLVTTVVTMIEIRFRKQENTWSAIVSKGINFISEHTGGDAMGEVMEQARGLLMDY